MSTDIDARSKKRAMLVFVGCCFMQALGLGTVLNSSSAYFAFVPTAIGVDMAVFSVWLTFYGIAALVGTFLAGILIPKLGARPVITVDSIIVALCLLAFTLADSTWNWQFVAIGLVMGLTGGMFFLYATPMLMGNWFGEKYLGRYLGIAQMMSGVGGAVFPVVFTTLSTIVGWQGVYYINAVLILVITVFALFVFCESPAKLGLHAYGAEEASASSNSTAREAAGVSLRYALPTLAFVLLFIGCMFFAFPGSYNSYVQSNAVAVLGDDALVFSSTLMIALQIGYIIASTVSGSLADKIGVRAVTIILSILCVIGYLMFAFIAFSEVLLLVAAFIFGMNNALITISVPMLVRSHFGMKSYDKILSYCMMGVGLMGSMGAPVIGFIYDNTGSYQLSFVIGAVVMVASLLIALLSFVPAKRVREAHWES